MYLRPIYKYNNGNGAQLCVKCSTIIHTGMMSRRLLCDKCRNNERAKAFWVIVILALTLLLVITRDYL